MTDLQKDIEKILKDGKVMYVACTQQTLVNRLLEVCQSYAYQQSKEDITSLFEEVKGCMDNVWSIHHKFEDALGLEPEEEDED